MRCRKHRTGIEVSMPARQSARVSKQGVGTYFIEPLTGVALQEQRLGPCRCDLLKHPLEQQRRQHGVDRVLTHHLSLRRLPPPSLPTPDFSQRHTGDDLNMLL
mmetsp:Transcript_13719/g.44817  ORF Transcript_13719/g.44817 Transcript_13719/m.44817 type:complete len:103 (+) Transcript_13719:375-683(+)